MLGAAGAAAIMLTGTAAAAALTSNTGTFTERQSFSRNDGVQNITSTAFTDVARVAVRIPPGTRRMIDARYTAETMCSGASAGWCSLRIIATRTSAPGFTVELNPAAGTNFAIDSTDGSWEGHAMERSSNYLPAGNYVVSTQAAVVNGATSLWLDDSHMAVEVIRP
ncbi:hypothetical protein GCM10010201_05130 [Pilimelia columellifera subsp. columellifera]|uniref:Uncharacterized protein n=2 Tax=Pilimelia TaxID=53370 RepID=A0ABP6AGG1_9ACTN